MKSENACGFSCWHPHWLQRYANSKWFLFIYGMLGTTQAMSYLYFVVTLTTIEKRFKIPSQTTGIILSGNEISQILLSLVLSYAAGQRNRPRWIAWGIVFSALSCFILALPHIIYGAGDNALELTKEYINLKDLNTNHLLNTTILVKGANKLCIGKTENEQCDELFSIVPLILIFLSQFVLGIGNTLYYSLGQSYLDDNTKKTNTPMMLAIAMSLRMLGPIFGFVLGYVSLSMYIDPTKTPIIDRDDPRWLGAWWFGWIFLGILMLVFAVFIGLFPKQLPKKKPINGETIDETPRMLKRGGGGGEDDEENDETRTLEQEVLGSLIEFPIMRDFPSALLRLLKNKLLMFNIFAGIFYILGASGYITFLSKYLEVQFNKNAAEATIITGPVSLIGMVTGFLLSGYVITRWKPSPSKLFFWNVIVGCIFLVGQVCYLFLSCGNNAIGFPIENGYLNLTTSCNSNCNCDGVKYTPICYQETTYFSPCHAGCNFYDSKLKHYSNCTCVRGDSQIFSTTKLTILPTFETTISTKEISTSTHSTTLIVNLTTSPLTTVPDTTILTTLNPILTDVQEPDIIQTFENDSNVTTESTTLTALVRKKKREIKQSDSTKIPTDNKTLWETLKVIPGPCLTGCAVGFYLFTAISTVVNWIAATGKIGTILISFRAVKKEDKAFSQGLTLMMISLFALIPGPILYGWIIDSTCLIWNYKCGRRGNCQLYDQKKFRQYINGTAFGLTLIGVVLDLLVWWYGRHIDLYGEREQNLRKKQPISPLLTKKSNDNNF